MPPLPSPPDPNAAHYAAYAKALTAWRALRPADRTGPGATPVPLWTDFDAKGARVPVASPGPGGAASQPVATPPAAPVKLAASASPVPDQPPKPVGQS